MRMIKLISIVITISIMILNTVGCSFMASSDKTSYLMSLNIKGEVKTIKTIEYGNKIEEGNFVDGDISDYYSTLATYDKDGMSINKMTYDMQSILVDEITWVYNNNVLERAECSNFKLHNCSVMEYNYNSEDELVELIYLDENSNIIQSVVFSYTTDGLEHMNYFLNEKDEKTYESELIYDDNNMLCEKLNYDIINDDKSKTVYEYDDNGNTILEKTIGDNGNARMIYKMEYDDNNNILVYSMMYGDNLLDYYNLEYIYDGEGNWSERFKYVDGEVIEHSIREIEYY